MNRRRPLHGPNLQLPVKSGQIGGLCLEPGQNEEANVLFGRPMRRDRPISRAFPLQYRDMRDAKAPREVLQGHFEMLADEPDLVAGQPRRFAAQGVEHGNRQLVVVDLGRPNTPHVKHRDIEKPHRKAESRVHDHFLNFGLHESRGR